MGVKKKRSASAPAATLFKVADEMKQWSALIAGELGTWPDVSTKKMFGMNSLYRGKVIFGALPGTRALFSASSIAFKLHDVSTKVQARVETDPGVHASGGIGQKWFAFELTSAEDIRGALEWLSLAYEQAIRVSSLKKSRKSRQTSRSR
jgi:hypothetical protein